MRWIVVACYDLKAAARIRNADVVNCEGCHCLKFLGE